MLRPVHAVGTAFFSLAVFACSGSSSTGDLNGGDGGGGFLLAPAPAKDAGGSSSSGGLFGGGSSSSGGSTSSSSSGGPAPSQCIQSGNATCDACLNQNCCAAIDACSKNQACLGLYQCVGQCTQNDQACVDQCLTQYGSGKAALQAVLACVDQACAGKC